MVRLAAGGVVPFAAALRSAPISGSCHAPKPKQSRPASGPNVNSVTAITARIAAVCDLLDREQQGAAMPTNYRKIAVALGIAFSAVTFNAASAAYAPTSDLEVRAAESPKQAAIEPQAELYCLALAVYFEGGSTAESEDGQRHIARVVIDRAKENQRKWGGAKLCDVVFYKRNNVCQFSFACIPAAQRTPRGGAAWQRSFAIAQEELAKTEVGDDGVRYYLNPKLTSNRNICRFRRELVPVVESGRHQFFREATAQERAVLAKSEFAECKDAKKGVAKVSADKKKRFASVSKKKSKKVRVAGR